MATLGYEWGFGNREAKVRRGTKNEHPPLDFNEPRLPDGEIKAVFPRRIREPCSAVRKYFPPTPPSVSQSHAGGFLQARNML